MKWFRLYDEIIDNPKIKFLEEKYCWRYIQILCILNRYSRETSKLPEIENLTRLLTIPLTEVQETIDVLVDKKLLQKHKHGYFCKAFKERQYISDSSTIRTKRFRERSKNDKDTVTVTDTDNNIINYIISIGLATTKQRAYALIENLKKEYPYEWIKEEIQYTFERRLGGGEYTIGFVRNRLKRRKENQKEELSIFDMD